MSYFINGRVFLYLLFISHLKICFRIDLVRVLVTIRDTSATTGLIHVYNYLHKNSRASIREKLYHDENMAHQFNHRQK